MEYLKQIDPIYKYGPCYYAKIGKSEDRKNAIKDQETYLGR